MAYDLVFGKTNRNWSSGYETPFIWTASAAKAEMQRILGVIDSVNLDVSKAVEEGKLSPEEWTEWHQSYLSSHEFLVKSMKDFFGWASHVTMARNIETEALKWRDLIASRGGVILGPKNLGPHGDPHSTSPWFLTLTVGGVAAAALLITAIKK
jgi:hypothetical protein